MADGGKLQAHVTFEGKKVVWFDRFQGWQQMDGWPKTQFYNGSRDSTAFFIWEAIRIYEEAYHLLHLSVKQLCL